uniref:FXYD domain-containing ion transport regulator n=1 Tax=Scophthalmus maximus TaxID=52904 RepID=A0A8D3BPY3_SCOMX
MTSFSTSVHSSPYPGVDIDPDADFVYDYYTLRVGGLVFAGVIVFLSIILLAGKSTALHPVSMCSCVGVQVCMCLS